LKTSFLLKNLVLKYVEKVILYFWIYLWDLKFFKEIKLNFYYLDHLMNRLNWNNVNTFIKKIYTFNWGDDSYDKKEMFLLLENYIEKFDFYLKTFLIFLLRVL